MRIDFCDFDQLKVKDLIELLNNFDRNAVINVKEEISFSFGSQPNETVEYLEIE